MPHHTPTPPSLHTHHSQEAWYIGTYIPCLLLVHMPTNICFMYKCYFQPHLFSYLNAYQKIWNCCLKYIYKWWYKLYLYIISFQFSNHTEMFFFTKIWVHIPQKFYSMCVFIYIYIYIYIYDIKKNILKLTQPILTFVDIHFFFHIYFYFLKSETFYQGIFNM